MNNFAILPSSTAITGVLRGARMSIASCAAIVPRVSSKYRRRSSALDAVHGQWSAAVAQVGSIGCRVRWRGRRRGSAAAVPPAPAAARQEGLDVDRFSGRAPHRRLGRSRRSPTGTTSRAPPSTPCRRVNQGSGQKADRSHAGSGRTRVRLVSSLFEDRPWCPSRRAPRAAPRPSWSAARSRVTTCGRFVPAPACRGCRSAPC